MPELPEVEVVRRGLDAYLPGRSIAGVSVLHARAIRRQRGGARALAAELVGAHIETVSRRGKYLWCVVRPRSGSEPRALVMHLGMSGQLLLPALSTGTLRHGRVKFSLNADRDLWFVDQRTFGGVYTDDLVADDQHGSLPSSVEHIARDPLDPDFDERAFSRDLRRRSTGIKRALLDQTLVSGIGNIYADESLWRTRVHYDKPCVTLSAAQVREMLDHVRDVMSQALDQGGTSFDSLYVNVNGESGYFDRSLDAYGRENQPCRRCGTAIRREPFMNRSSYRCPRCQRAPRQQG